MKVGSMINCYEWRWKGFELHFHTGGPYWPWFRIRWIRFFNGPFIHMWSA